jgi:hypothetical protein
VLCQRGHGVVVARPVVREHQRQQDVATDAVVHHVRLQGGAGGLVVGHQKLALPAGVAQGLH